MRPLQGYRWSKRGENHGGQCDEILARDLAAVEADDNRLVEVLITQNQFDALVPWCSTAVAPPSVNLRRIRK
ncbi:glycoside hydrolase family protein [Neorhizobium sp. DAR64872/K0K18]|uniref:glycoside hydrolase family protein n=1 Tax=Neorhizobium sp. DAR64872/K0K18 TaxID=3421958 RepID=UPI003D2B428B